MTNTYNYTEEAFLLSSLQEMVKVWASGSGKAGFNLNICDGLAGYNSTFNLDTQVMLIAILIFPQIINLRSNRFISLNRKPLFLSAAAVERDQHGVHVIA